MALPTVKSLCAALGSDLRPADTRPISDMPITAVHISELLDPSPYVSGGELLMTTGLALPESKMGCRRYVSTVRRSGVSALAIGLGPVHQEVPPQLASVCVELSFPLLVVPVATPFLRITKAYWQAVSRSTEQHLTDAIAAHRTLVDAAASPDPVASVLRRLARWLDGWAATLDADGLLSQVHPAGFADAAEVMQQEVSRLEVAGVHSVASFSAAGNVVVLYPLVVANRIEGYLAVGTHEQLDVAQRAVALTACGLLSLDATRVAGEESAESAHREDIAYLLDEGEVEAAGRLSVRSGQPVMTREVRLLSVLAREVQGVASAVRRWCPDALGVPESRTRQWFILPSTHGPLEKLVERVSATDPAATGVVSELVRPDRINAVRVRQSHVLAAGPTGTFKLPRATESTDRLSARLDRLVDAGPQLMEALVAFLRSHGQWEQASRGLAVHRNTLRYRVHRAREVLELDLDDPDVTAQLWLLLRERGLA